MKKLIVILTLITLLVSCGNAQTYTLKNCVVVEVKETGEATLVDEADNAWIVVDDEIEVGATCDLVMNDNNTDEVEDDVIVKINWKA